MKSAIKEINYRLQKAGINFIINQYIFDLFNKVYDIKGNEKFCYAHRQYKMPLYSYSTQAIDLIVHEISKDPQNIKKHLKLLIV